MSVSENMNIEQYFGSIVIISGPSGVGKSTIYNYIKSNSDLKLHFSVSCTTRTRRTAEINDLSYHFISEDEFQQHVANKDFLEYANVHGFNYGTLMSELLPVKEGVDILLDIDVQGMRKVKKALEENPFLASRLVTVFIMPPSMQELEKRLRGRKTDPEDAILRRLGNAKKEMDAWREYDYLIINKDSNESSTVLAQIMKAAHFNTRRLTEETWMK